MDLTKYTEFLIAQLRLLRLPSDEIIYRQDALYKARKECTDRHITTRYYNLAHEIKCMMFLRKFGNIRIAMDSNHEAGCDALLNNYYQIEFGCASPGTKTSENGYDRFGFPNIKNIIFMIIVKQNVFCLNVLQVHLLLSMTLLKSIREKPYPKQCHI